MLLIPLFFTVSGQEEEEHFPRCLWYQVWPGAHAEAGSVQAAHTQDEGPAEEEGGGGHRRAGWTGSQSGQSRELMSVMEQLHCFLLLCMWMNVQYWSVSHQSDTGHPPHL